MLYSLTHDLSKLTSILTSGDKNWMLVLPAGTIDPRGHKRFKVGELADMQAIVANTKAFAGDTELMVDYDHQAMTHGDVGGTAKAAGWVKELQARADGIWARIEWTDAAAAAIKAGEYRYLSPTFTSDINQNVDKLLNIGLVNSPALDLEAIAASAKFNMEKNTMLKKIRELLKLDENADEAAVIAALEKALAKKSDAKPDEKVTAAAIGEAIKPIALAAGLEEGADGKAIISAITKLADADGGGGEGEAFTALKADHTKLATEHAALKNGIAQDKATSFVDGAIKAGHAGVAALKAHYIARHVKDPASVEKEIGALPILGDGGEIISGVPNGDGGTSLSASHKDAAVALGLSEEDYKKTLEEETV